MSPHKLTPTEDAVLSVLLFAVIGYLAVVNWHASIVVLLMLLLAQGVQKNR